MLQARQRLQPFLPTGISLSISSTIGEKRGSDKETLLVINKLSNREVVDRESLSSPVSVLGFGLLGHGDVDTNFRDCREHSPVPSCCDSLAGYYLIFLDVVPTSLKTIHMNTFG